MTPASTTTTAAMAMRSPRPRGFRAGTLPLDVLRCSRSSVGVRMPVGVIVLLTVGSQGNCATLSATVRPQWDGVRTGLLEAINSPVGGGAGGTPEPHRLRSPNDASGSCADVWDRRVLDHERTLSGCRFVPVAVA